MGESLWKISFSHISTGYEGSWGIFCVNNTWKKAEKSGYVDVSHKLIPFDITITSIIQTVCLQWYLESIINLNSHKMAAIMLSCYWYVNNINSLCVLCLSVWEGSPAGGLLKENHIIICCYSLKTVNLVVCHSNFRVSFSGFPWWFFALSPGRAKWGVDKTWGRMQHRIHHAFTSASSSKKASRTRLAAVLQRDPKTFFGGKWGKKGFCRQAYFRAKTETPVNQAKSLPVPPFS